MAKPNRFYKDIYLSPKWRKWNKIQLLKLEKSAINLWARLDTLTPGEREWASGIAQLSATGLKRIQEAEEYVKFTTITKRTFRMYRKPGKKNIVIIFNFYKPHEKRYKANSWLMSAGLPTPAHPRRKVLFFREALSVDGFKLVDEGKFDYRYPDFNKSYNTLYGKKVYKFASKAIDTESRMWVRTL